MRGYGRGWRGLLQTMILAPQSAIQPNFSLLGYQDLPFAVQSDWFAGSASVRTFALNELLGTKVRALYQRKKGRDLFDLWYALVHCNCEPEQIIACFIKYTT